MMHTKPSRILLSFFSLLLALSFSAEAGYKSGYKSSYRSSYKPSSSYRTGVSSSTSVNQSKSISSNPVTTGSKSVVADANAGATIALGSALPSAQSVRKTGAGGGAKAANSVSGAKLVDKKGKITMSNKTPEKSLKHEQLSSPQAKTSLSTNAPSPGLSKTIRERESSGGLNWTHLAMLYWLTSSSNSHASSMSEADKSWIQQQIREAESNGANRAEAINELNTSGIDTTNLQTAMKTNGPVAFQYDLPKAFTAGRIWMFVVSATHKGEQLAPTCQLDGATFMKKQNGLLIKWKAPSSPGQKTVMNCTAFGVKETYTLVTS